MFYSSLHVLLLQFHRGLMQSPGSSSQTSSFVSQVRFKGRIQLQRPLCITALPGLACSSRDAAEDWQNKGVSLPNHAAAAGELGEHIKSTVLTLLVLPAHLNCSFCVRIAAHAARKEKEEKLVSITSCSLIWGPPWLSEVFSCHSPPSNAKSFVVTTGKGCSV